ncbi:hypothetical protein [Desulfatibacillum aliphaticivorans]|uniref:hypothetical protein n=1 Tax=Desulfatibacillum aliphaticivorans TaxID=218208 RepID=UPI0005C1807C|nr:hypothetical protein [Desulfatibacillum aliphaticivorans]
MKENAGKNWQTLIVALALCLGFLQSASAGSLVYTSKVERMPDLGQHNGMGLLPYDGRGYCAAAAVSNGIMWFFLNGYPAIAEDHGQEDITHARLAALLGSGRYMKVDPRKGASPTYVMIGLKKYLEDRGFGWATIQYQGWRKHPKAFHTGVIQPDLDWIKKGLTGPGAVWLNVGWYNFDRTSSSYIRVGGHWVTLAGYGEDREGTPDPEVLIILDPALRRAVRGPVPIYVKAKQIEALPTGIKPAISIGRSLGYIDKMTGANDETIEGEDASSMTAVGFYKLIGELKTANRADFALIDGAVVLRLDQGRRRLRR